MTQEQIVYLVELSNTLFSIDFSLSHPRMDKHNQQQEIIDNIAKICSRDKRKLLIEIMSNNKEEK